MASPAIVLVRPQLGENIGKAARAMLNFGLTDLRLVAPRDGWPNSDAGPSAAGADEVLDKARIYETTDDAVADLDMVFAATVRPRGMLKEVVTPEEAARRGRETKAAGVLFGAERSGLENDDIVRADAILTIPVNPAFGSLNIAQAVIVFAYEWFKGGDNTAPAELVGDRLGPATKADLKGLIDHLEEELAARGYFHPTHRAGVMRRTLRNILQRRQLTAQEVRTLRGVVKCLAERERGE